MEILLKPPVLFIIFVAIFGGLMLYLRRYEKKAHESDKSGTENKGATESYACGQRNYESYVNPDYKQFVKYAFVFCVMHVLVMVVSTAPKGEMLLPLAYVAAGVLSLVIIFRK